MTKPCSSTRHASLRALTLALRDGNGWRYIGHVGTGFSHEVLEDLHSELIKLKTEKSPFPSKVKDQNVTTWVKPSLVKA